MINHTNRGARQNVRPRQVAVTTRTYFTFRIDQWTDDGENITSTWPGSRISR